MTLTGDTGTLWEWSLTQFRERTASADPTPGGGSAAMVSAAIGLGLVLMALRVTARRSDGDPLALAPLIEAGERRLAELAEHADADIAVFEGYMSALRQPRATEEEKAARRAALDQATQAATEVPLNAAQVTLEALDIARQAAHLAHANIVSDVGAGSALLFGALTAVLYSVDINLKGMTDRDAAADYARSRAHLQQAAEQRRAAIANAVAHRLG